MSEQQTEKRSTSAEIKKQIEDATKAAKEGQLPLTGQVAAEINASASTPAIDAKPESKPDHPQKDASAAEGAAATESADLKEWAKKKGIDWTTEDSIIAALRKSDQAFHAKRQAEKAREGATPPSYAPPPPAYQPPPQYPQPPAQIPPVPNRATLENIARQYNMTVDDAERLVTFNRDFFEAVMRSERAQWQAKVAEIERENLKNSVFRELSSDPVFRRPDVAMEFHTVLDQMQETDPRSFEQDPSAYRRAFDRALQNIARRNLEGRPLQEGVPPNARTMSPPTTPPRPLGRGSGGSMYESESGIDPAQFAKLPLEEKRKVLEGMGLRPA